MVPEIWSATDRIFVILDHFLSFYPPMDPENQNFGKINNTPVDISILQICTRNHSHMVYGSWDMKCNRQNLLSFWTSFYSFTPLTTWKIKILKNWKKFLEILSFNTCVPYMTIIWCIVPEIWSVTDRIFCHSRPFFAFLPPQQSKKSKFWQNKKKFWRYHFAHVYHKCQSYDVWFLRYEAWQTELFVILDCFLPFYPPDNQKNQNFEKLKKAPGDIIILHLWTINDNQIMYGSWDIEHDRHILFVILDHFLLFYPLTTLSIKILKKLKKRLDILSFYTCVHMCTISQEPYIIWL